jgi:hypothetical protein
MARDPDAAFYFYHMGCNQSRGTDLRMRFNFNEVLCSNIEKLIV